MAGEIKLLSIKRNEEASYFYEDKDSTTLESNKNEVVKVEKSRKAPQLSKKERKEEERKSKKEKKQKMNEMKQLEKEKKKSLKNSRKEVIGSVDTTRPSSNTVIKTNGDVKINGGFQVGLDVDETAKNNEGESSSGHEDESNHHEDLVKEDERASEHELSTKTHTSSSVEEVNLEHSRAEETKMIEDTITANVAETNEDAPPEILPQPRVSPYMVEPTGGEHVEIEISDVTDMDTDASSSNQVVILQYSSDASTHQNGVATHQNGVASEEGEIVFVTVEEVESAVDLDQIFTECDKPEGGEVEKEEKRKSVRFSEETEEIGNCEVESKDHEHASLNLGGDFTDSSDGDSAEQRQTSETVVEIVAQEEQNKVEGCVDADHVASLELENDTETDLEESVVALVKVNGDAKAKVNGHEAKISNTGMADFVEVSLNESNEHRNTAAKKGKKKGSLFTRCCFP